MDKLLIAALIAAATAFASTLEEGKPAKGKSDDFAEDAPPAKKGKKDDEDPSSDLDELKATMKALVKAKGRDAALALLKKAKIETLNDCPPAKVAPLLKAAKAALEEDDEL